MAKYQNSGLLEGLTLGKATDYSDQYDPSLLQGVPRSLNRDDLDIDQSNLPFFGEDIWYGYEVSWLNAKGKPVVAVAEFHFPCSSDNLIESKSFKLYLNSFNQTRFDSQAQVLEHMTNDLSKVAGAHATVRLFPVDNCPPLAIAATKATCIDELDVEIDQYQYQPTLLADATGKGKKQVTEQLVSHLLKSNCLITNQPDWASVYISYTGNEIDKEKLLKYLISFRDHNEFHEQCVERIYCDIQQFCNPKYLTVFARYTRRGGLDINPYRSSLPSNAPSSRSLRQ
ncbi:NADPH-dependent 7-cyano-7-deazaguanine reductase QueF [Thalassotalea euphylliae]|uniref:NADPH-dependent 7-cyano-7-deazaguanine reductase n=1 Tax=Thalassotalea euphylliae TaxID=1655234 RepID=A0A3E0UED7_9GAMM|nr:NADPH-dependent 7-cyano-7-deazaguanine reductase QueF [Thalassotalea euphylliae]REL35220.1 NADPH-dependent 7-cyano-7-deazaguanine reductase QueF [Thalassotalea euphylliae]